jgi:uncharacterized membrane protein
MTSTDTDHRGNGLRSNPVIARLGEAALDYAKALGSEAADKVAEKVGDVTDNLNRSANNGGFTAPAVTTAVRRVAEGDSPVKAALGGVGAGIKEKVAGALGRRRGGSGNKKFMSIIEDIRVGVPVNVAYDQWTQFQEFSTFMKGVESVDKTDEVNSNWRVKVFKSRRNWKGTVTEAIPDRRIAWTTDGAKGTTKGVVTFHPLADDLTQILVVMEYYPSGPVEKTGNLWRAPGRRARLDLKHYRRFLMQRDDEPEGWRGEIRDGEVVREPGEEEEPQDRAARRGPAGEEEEQPAAVEAEEEGYEEEPEEGAEEEEEEEEEEPEEEYEGAEAEGEPEEEEEEEEYEGAEAEGEPEEEEPEAEPERAEEEPEEERPRRPARRREPVGTGRR